MTTDQRVPPTPPAAGQEPAKKAIDLSLTQVLGGALAAMTAAFLGSRLSVAGTVLGAAVASVVAAVAGSIYTASLRSTRERVRTVWQGRAGDGIPTTVEATSWHDAGSPSDAPVQPSAPAPAETPRRPRAQWKTVLLSALAAFLLAGVALTGLELATGQSLSGEQGTTVSQVTDPRPAAPQETASPSAKPSSASPSPTSSQTPTSAPTPSASSTVPTPAPQASRAQPSAPAASPTPEAPPTTSAATPGG